MQIERARRPARSVRGGELSGRLHAVALLPANHESDAEEESNPDPGADTDRPVVPGEVGGRAARDRNVGLELLVDPCDALIAETVSLQARGSGVLRAP